jgi:hypothetical protein
MPYRALPETEEKLAASKTCDRVGSEDLRESVTPMPEKERAAVP